jgi:4-hydroxy-tetrahydrodipicolinate synthase
MMMMLKAIEGMIAPIVVPFTRDDMIDEKALRQDILHLIRHGIHGISSGGSTGEGAILSDAELRRCLEIIMEEKPSDMPVIAGIIRNSTKDVIRAALDAKEIGVDALLITPVFYYGATAEGNYAFFQEISDRVQLPIIIYNVVPTNVVSVEDFLKLLSIEQVVGIKEVDPVRLSELGSLCAKNEKEKIYSACDQMLYGTYVSGAIGAISALITVAPELCVEQWNAFKNGDQRTAMEIQIKLVPVVRTYLQKPFPGKVKELLNLQNREVGIARSPNVMPTLQEKAIMKDALRNAGLLLR